MTTPRFPWQTWLFRIGYFCLVLLVVAYLGLWWLMDTASVSTHGHFDYGRGNIEVPSEPRVQVNETSPLTQALINRWSSKALLDWQEEGKVNVPRVLLAKLAKGQEVQLVNAYIQAAHVRGTVGSVGPFHASGDYDFTLAVLCLLLFTFGDSPDLLYPETVDHIVNVLMTQEGGTPVEFTPRLLGLPLRDTENHILMTEGSRYLKNRWLNLHGENRPEFDNEQNGLEQFLLEHLGFMETAGFHEYNSRPYIGYTLTALLNLQSFASEPVKQSATRILDRANWEYALGSFQLRRFPPFRRQPRRASDTDLDGDYHTAMIKAWLSLSESSSTVNLGSIRAGDHHALWVPFTDYRLPAQTKDWILEKPIEYFVRMGHGEDGSPEIYSGGPNYLITAGGVAKDRFKQSVARPTTLMLADREMELSGLLRISGMGADYRTWNNTGVFERFAVGKKLLIPKGWLPTQQANHWSLYQREGVNIATFSTPELGLFYILPPGVDQNFNAIVRLNSDPKKLVSRFLSANGEAFEYDLNAPNDTWVMKFPEYSRDIGRWPLMNVDLVGIGTMPSRSTTSGLLGQM